MCGRTTHTHSHIPNDKKICGCLFALEIIQRKSVYTLLLQKDAPHPLKFKQRKLYAYICADLHPFDLPTYVIQVLLNIWYMYCNFSGGLQNFPRKGRKILHIRVHTHMVYQFLFIAVAPLIGQEPHALHFLHIAYRQKGEMLQLSEC